MRRGCYFRTALCLGLALIVSGCSSQKKSTVSGFLGDPSVYAQLTDHPSLEGVKVFRSGPTPLAAYDAFIIPPAKVYLSEQGRARDISPEELDELAQYFRNEVQNALGDGYRITNVPGEGVAILRIAITDADPNIALMNLHPGSLILGGGLGGASAELELVDSVTGKRVVAATASSKGKRYEYSAGLSKWGHTKSVLADWAKIIRKRVDEDHGVTTDEDHGVAQG